MLAFLPPDVAAEIKSGAWHETCSRMLAYMAAHAIKAVFYSSADYPLPLKELADAPPILYYIGDISLVQ